MAFKLSCVLLCARSTLANSFLFFASSCLVIPCSFSYTSHPPKNPLRVVWYQWVSKGYPLVYDPLHANNVIEKFKGKTNLYRKSGDCSLLITGLELSHHEEKIYAWIDPENVGWRTYKFYDVTSTVLVDGVHHNITIEPELADATEGVAKNFICSVYHSCQKENPTITWNYENMQVTERSKTLSGLNQISYSSITFLAAKEDHGKKLICTAKFSGGDISASVVLHVQRVVIVGFFVFIIKKKRPILLAFESSLHLVIQPVTLKKCKNLSLSSVQTI
uniref:Ig-like domain-containing protein n=1 Tax=Sinocyclocheilus anshuiensis TaxID=1608454 RepID=A0A671TBE3_9TELE